MEKKDNILDRVGSFVAGPKYGEEVAKAYVPLPLPPKPELDLPRLYPLIDRANTALGRLDGMSLVLPDPHLFIYMYIRKEAVLSSQIEGTQSSLSDLLLFENEDALGAPMDDVTEVSRYVNAMEFGLKRLDEIPLSLRLIKEIHSVLMTEARGGERTPGEFRTSQNWIGGTRPSNAIYVPPPANLVIEKMGELESFIHEEKDKLPILVKAALAHVQFETVHPFLDGNGRLGRLLITFILCNAGILNQPLLYLSLYLKTNRDKYYELLQDVRMKGVWEEWIEFFLTGVIETSEQATNTAAKVIALFNTDRKKIENSKSNSAALIQVHRFFKNRIVSKTNAITENTGLSLPTVLRSLDALVELGILEETTGKQRNKVFRYTNYLILLNDGAEPISK